MKNTININASAITRSTIAALFELKSLKKALKSKEAKEAKAAHEAAKAAKAAAKAAEIEAIRLHQQAHMQQLKAAAKAVANAAEAKFLEVKKTSIKEYLGVSKMSTFRVDSYTLGIKELTTELFEELSSSANKEEVILKFFELNGEPISLIYKGEKALQAPSPIFEYLKLEDGGYTPIVSTVDTLIREKIPFGSLSSDWNKYEEEIANVAKVIFRYCSEVGVKYSSEKEEKTYKLFTAGGSGIKEGNFYAVEVSRFDELRSHFNVGNEDLHLNSANFIRKLALAFRPGVKLGSFVVNNNNTFVSPSNKIEVETNVPVININKVGEIVGTTNKAIRAFADGMSVIIWDNLPNDVKYFIEEGSVLQLWSNDYIILKTEAIVLSLKRLNALNKFFDINKELVLENGKVVKASELTLITTTDAIKDKTLKNIPDCGSSVWLYSEESSSVYSHKYGATSRQILESAQGLNPAFAKKTRMLIESMNTYKGVMNVMMSQPGNTGILSTIAEFATSEFGVAETEKRYVKRIGDAVGGKYKSAAFTSHIVEDYVAFLQVVLGYVEKTSEGILTGFLKDSNAKIGVLNSGEIYCEKVAETEVAVDRYPHLANETVPMKNISNKHSIDVHVAYSGVSGCVLNVLDATTIIIKGDCDGDEVRISTDKEYVRVAKLNMFKTMNIVNNEEQDGGNLSVIDTLAYGVLTNFIGTGSNMVRNAWEAYSEAESDDERQSILTDITRLVAWCNWYVDAWKHGFPVSMDECIVRKYKGKHPYTQTGKKSFVSENGKVTMHDFADIRWIDGTNVGKLHKGSTPNNLAMNLLGLQDDFNGYLVHLDQWRGLGKIKKSQVGTEYVEVNEASKLPLRMTVEPTEFDGRLFCMNKRKHNEDYLDAIKLFANRMPISASMQDELDQYGLHLEGKHTPERIIRALWIADVKATMDIVSDGDSKVGASAIREARHAAEARILKYYAEQFGDSKRHVFLAMYELAAIICFGKLDAIGINDTNRESFTKWSIDVFGRNWYEVAKKNGAAITKLSDEANDFIEAWEDEAEIEEMF